MSAKKDSFYRQFILDLLSKLDKGRLSLRLPEGDEIIFGIEDSPTTARVYIHNDDFFKKCVFFGDIGFGEAYVDGDWDTPDITAVISWMLLNVEKHPTLMDEKERRSPINFLSFVNKFHHRMNVNTLKKSHKNIAAHYDLGNEFFRLFLDPSMTYSSAYFSSSHPMTLEEAQNKKYDELCRKLKLKTQDRLLEIGCGWGGFACHAAKHYHCDVTAITISAEQFEYASKRVQKEGLSHKVKILKQDYRHVTGAFDKLASIEMIEAVGHEFLDAFFAQCHKLLKKDGLLGMQMILSPDHRYESFRKNVDWIQKYIFPGGLLPSMEVILRAMRRTGNLGLLDYEDMTTSYVKTLDLWRRRFNQEMGQVKKLGFDDAFVRKWNYYLSYCEAAFKTRNIGVAQAIFTRPNNHSIDNE